MCRWFRLLLVPLSIALGLESDEAVGQNITTAANPATSAENPPAPPTGNLTTSSAKPATAAANVTASAPTPESKTASTVGISGNPGAVNTTTGTGWLGREIGISADTGVSLGGVWLGDANWIMSGGANPGNVTFNSLLIADFHVDLEKAIGLKGASIGSEFLQFNGQPTNAEAGSVQGYNSLPGLPPLNRSELYQLWWRQEFFDGKLIVRIGKLVPTIDFNSVVRPVPERGENESIPAVSGLIYTPLYINPTMVGVSPGYYNSAYGVTATYVPTKQFYMSYGAYDGSGAQGVQTGLTGPNFDGHYFQLFEAGYAWELGAQRKPGVIAAGGWSQSGLLSLPSPSTVTQNGAQGVYAFGSQRLWFANPGKDNSGVSAFFQYGINDAKTLPINQYLGSGVTAFGLVPSRRSDSFGAGVAWSELNRNIYARRDEWMLQAYYQAHLFGTAYFQPAVTFIPNPGASPNLSPTWTLTMRLLILF
jgi:porin